MKESNSNVLLPDPDLDCASTIVIWLAPGLVLGVHEAADIARLRSISSTVLSSSTISELASVCMNSLTAVSAGTSTETDVVFTSTVISTLDFHPTPRFEHHNQRSDKCGCLSKLSGLGPGHCIHSSVPLAHNEYAAGSVER